MKIAIKQIRRVIAEEIRRRLNELEDQAQSYQPSTKKAPSGPPLPPDKRHFVHGMQIASKLYRQGMDLISITFELEKQGFDQDDIDLIFGAMNEALIKKLKRLTEMRDEHNVIKGPWSEDPGPQPDYMSQHGEQDIEDAPDQEQDCGFCERSGKCPACGGEGGDTTCMCSGGGDCPECVGRVMTGRKHV